MTRTANTRIPRHLLPSWPMLRDELEDWKSRLWGETEEGWPAGRWAPAVDLLETGTALEARLDLPGMNPEEIDIQVSGQTLTVRGERKEEVEESRNIWHRLERRKGAFTRSLTLPCPVNEEEVAAAYHAGVLTITLPKTEETRAHKIKVQT